MQTSKQDRKAHASYVNENIWSSKMQRKFVPAHFKMREEKFGVPVLWVNDNTQYGANISYFFPSDELVRR